MHYGFSLAIEWKKNWKKKPQKTNINNSVKHTNNKYTSNGLF